MGAFVLISEPPVMSCWSRMCLEGLPGAPPARTLAQQGLRPQCCQEAALTSGGVWCGRGAACGWQGLEGSSGRRGLGAAHRK